MIIYNKLVRDYIDRILTEKGKRFKMHSASDEEFVRKAREKLLEEVDEYLRAEGDDKIKELADITQVMRILVQFEGYKWEEFEQIRQSRETERGGFERRLILEEAEE